MGYIFISNYVPLNFVDTSRALPSIHNFKHFDEFKTSERLLPWQQKTYYQQKWQKDDIIFIQVEADYDPINVKVVGEDGAVYNSFLMDVITSIGSKIFLQCSIALDYLPEGIYKIVLSALDIELESECIHVKQKWPGTLLYKYSHSSNKGLLWQTGIYFLLRVEGSIALFTPVGTRTVYVDTPFNSKTVKGYSARNFTLYVGDSGGVPDYIADKIQNIFDCNNILIDGKPFSAKDEGAKMNATREDYYPLTGWTLEIAEVVNRNGKRFETSGLVEYKVAIDYVVEGKMFGPIYGSANDNTYTIKKLG